MENNTVSKKQKKENNAKNRDVMRLKRAWERLKNRQAFVPLRKAKIYSVDVIDDGNGGKTLQVRMSDGGKFNDNGDKRNVFHTIVHKRKRGFSRLMSLVEIARVAGVDTVSSSLPPDLRRVFMRIYKRQVGNENPAQQTTPEKNEEKESFNQKLQQVAAIRHKRFIDSSVVQNLIKEH
ncbi:MAG: hypothetical protein IJ846_07495 [Alphaproteobacteria bacterium]|nr:hypothetical protein [Alphaproteobacteria bacterium]